MSKNWNIFALQGQELDDMTFRDEMLEQQGIEIPLDLVNTPKINDFVIDKVYEKNIQDLQSVDNPATGQTYTPDEAKEEARIYANQSRKNISKLIQAKKKQK